MAEAFDPDDVEKFFPAIAAAARGVAAIGAKAAKKVAQGGAAAAGKVAQGGAAAAGKVKEGVGAAATKVKEVGTAAADKVNEVADKAKNITPEQKKKLGAAVGVMQQMDQRRMQAEQQKREQHQRASEMARSAASTGTGIGKSDEAFEIDYSQPSHLETGTFKPDDMCQLCKERPAQYKTGYSARGRPHSPIQYNLCESCFDSFSHGGNMATYSRFIRGGPMDLAWRLLKAPFEPSSIKRLPDAQKPVEIAPGEYFTDPDSPIKRRWEAEFVHPKSGKRSMFDAYMSRGDPHEEGARLSVVNREGSEAQGQADVSFLDEDPFEEGGHRWISEGVEVPESQRGSGIGSSMYDLIAHLIAGGSGSPAEKGRFLRDDEQSPEAYEMWERKNEGMGNWLPDNLERRWVEHQKNASEPMDIAWRLLKQQTFNDYFGVKDQWISLPKEGMDERPELYGEVAEAMNIAYAPIGGHAKYKNADDLRGEGKHARYDLIDNDEDPYVDAAHIFQDTEHGFKSSVLGQDGSRTGRRAVVGHAVEAMNTPGHFMEASGPMAAVLERNQVGVVESPEMIQRVLAGKDIRMHPDGGGVYTRTIGDEEHDKRIFGQPLESAVAVTQPYMEQVYDQQSMTNPFDLFGKSEVLVKERKTPEAMRHKREYDAAYNKRPDQVKYREELNRERRRRGIMGSHDHMDVSHTQGGKLTLEPEHSNRARHFREKGTLRVMKSMRDDLELLRNLMQGPMDEQDKKIATAMVGMLEERHGDDEEEEDELLRPMFGGGDLFV